MFLEVRSPKGLAANHIGKLDGFPPAPEHHPPAAAASGGGSMVWLSWSYTALPWEAW